MPRELHDFYFREAKREGYLSRAAYKLIEIDDRKHILKRGDLVLDCGCAPGSWLQVAAKRVGPTGTVVGIDLVPVRETIAPHVVTTCGDLFTLTSDDLRALLLDRASTCPSARQGVFDVVLSDMAPNTTGDQSIDHHQSMNLCHLVLDRCRELLRHEGNLVMKAFEGEAYRDLLVRAGAVFTDARGFKPKASRDVSREMFVIGRGYRGEAERDAPPPARTPSPGWKHA